MYIRVPYEFMINTSGGEGIRVWYTVSYYVSICTHHKVKYGVDVMKNNACISKDDLLLHKLSTGG